MCLEGLLRVLVSPILHNHQPLTDVIGTGKTLVGAFDEGANHRNGSEV